MKLPNESVTNVRITVLNPSLSHTRRLTPVATTSFLFQTMEASMTSYSIRANLFICFNLVSTITCNTQMALILLPQFCHHNPKYEHASLHNKRMPALIFTRIASSGNQVVSPHHNRSYWNRMTAKSLFVAISGPQV